MTSSAYQKKLQEHYVPLLQEHGTSYRAVDWGSERSHMLRFQVCLGVGDLNGREVLDVGCGVGHLVDYLRTNGIGCSYLGIDALPEMVVAARSRHPHWRFQQGSLLELADKLEADYVLASGLFTFCTREEVEATLRAMFKVCGTAVAFNSLSTWATQKEPGEFHADPLAMVEFCRTMTPWVTLRHDYLPHDFTIYMYKKAVPE